MEQLVNITKFLNINYYCLLLFNNSILKLIALKSKVPENYNK